MIQVIEGGQVLDATAKVLKALTLLTMVLIIGGCGGGGGGGSTPQIEAPCDLLYALAIITVESGTPITPQTPTVACGVVVTWSVVPMLPAGLSISQIDGTISGTATVPGTDQFYDVTAANAGGSISFMIRIIVNPPAPCGLMYPLAFIIAQEGVALPPQTPAVSCGAVASWDSVPALPAGLSISQVDGTISGTPTTSGTDDDYFITASNVSGSTSFTIRIVVNPPAPCNLVYPLSFVIIPGGVTLAPLVPTVGCGAVTSWQVNPALPVGLQMDANDGTISGMATFEGYDQIHIISASNAGGTATFALQIRLDPIYTYAVNAAPGSYSGVTGLGQVSLVLTLAEDSGNPSYPTDVAGFSLAMSYQPDLLSVTNLDQSAVMQTLNGGAGPSFWYQQIEADEVVLGAIFSFMDLAVMQFDTEKEIAVLDLDTVPGMFIGQTGDIPVSFEWVEESQYTNSANDLLVVEDSAQGVRPLTIEAVVQMVRSD